MLVGFFQTVRRYGVPVTITEWLDLLYALNANLVAMDIDEFYQLARLCLVKNEQHYDKFDRAFATFVHGLEAQPLSEMVPKAWLDPEFIRQLSEQDKARLQALGGLEALLEAFRQRLQEQHDKHAGGSKWIGTGGTSPFGAYGYHPEGIRLGQQGSGARRAVKVWDQRQFQSLDSDEELNNRSIKVALRQLRRFARSGAREELDLAATIQATSKQAGLLDLQFTAQRHNAVKVLLLLDIGGSMDDYVWQCRQLFAACRSEFKHLEIFYFHNCIYDHVWRDAKRRPQDVVPTPVLWQTYSADYRLLLVGDATMGPYEISYPGGSVEHYNSESGETWLKRLLAHYPKAAWLNPQPVSLWRDYPSIGLLQKLLGGRMCEWTLDGLNQVIGWLKKSVIS